MFSTQAHVVEIKAYLAIVTITVVINAFVHGKRDGLD